MNFPKETSLWHVWAPSLWKSNISIFRSFLWGWSDDQRWLCQALTYRVKVWLPVFQELGGGDGTWGLWPYLVSAVPASPGPETPATAIPLLSFSRMGERQSLGCVDLGKESGDVTASQTDLKPILILAPLALTPTPRGTHCCQFMILMGILAYRSGWFSTHCAVSLRFNFLSIFLGRLGKLPLN